MNILLGVGQGGGETPSCQGILLFLKYAGFQQSRYFQNSVLIIVMAEIGPGEE
jgi:hypothetical protein